MSRCSNFSWLMPRRISLGQVHNDIPFGPSNNISRHQSSIGPGRFVGERMGRAFQSEPFGSGVLAMTRFPDTS